MSLKAEIAAELQQAMRDRDQTRLGTLRLVNAAIKDQEIARRGGEEGVPTELADDDIRSILAKMIKQRKESIRAFADGGRADLAAREQAEVDVIAGFLPQPMDAAETAAAIDRAIADAGATSLRDMGKVMALLKDRHAGRMDFAVIGPEVKSRLSG